MSSGIAALIAHVGFWVLLVYGWAWGEIGLKWGTVFLSVWLAGYFITPLWPMIGDGIFTSLAAALDIGLVFVIFKGDVRLT
jgi:hypothetical protein